MNSDSTFVITEDSQKDGMFPPKNQIVALYMLICHLPYIYFVFDVGDMSKGTLNTTKQLDLVPTWFMLKIW